MNSQARCPRINASALVISGIRAYAGKSSLADKHDQTYPASDDTSNRGPSIDVIEPRLRFSLAAILHVIGVFLLFIGMGDALGIRNSNHDLFEELLGVSAVACLSPPVCLWSSLGRSGADGCTCRATEITCRS